MTSIRLTQKLLSGPTYVAKPGYMPGFVTATAYGRTISINGFELALRRNRNPLRAYRNAIAYMESKGIAVRPTLFTA